MENPCKKCLVRVTCSGSYKVMSCEKFHEWVQKAIKEMIKERKTIGNPCKNCLVRAICIDPCSEIDDYAIHISKNDKLLIESDDSFKYWIYTYELRAAMIELYERSKEKLKEGV